jgi:parvulin-like peptidyl-prolyl isomerase
MVDVARSGNRLRVALGWYICISFLVGGCGDSDNPGVNDDRTGRAKILQQAALPGVLVVGDETVTAEQVIQAPIEQEGEVIALAEHFKPLAQTTDLAQFKEWARPQVEEMVMTEVRSILLYRKARLEAGDQLDEALEKAAEQEWRKFVLRFGGDEAKAEEALRENGMDRKEFKEQRKRMILTQSYVSARMPGNRPITHRELLDCYNRMKDEFFRTPARLQFQLIDIQPAKLELNQAGQDPFRQARELANELVKQLKAGEDFGKLAKQYSHGHRREFEGLWKPMQPDSLAKPYDVLAEAAEEIEPGQIASPIETEGHVFIMKLIESRPESYKPFEEVQRELETETIRRRREQAFDEIKADLAEQAELGRMDEFVDYCLERLYRLGRQTPGNSMR